MLKIMFNIDIIYQLLDIKIWGPNALALVAAPGPALLYLLRI
jgi:hypothetical protein